MVASTLTIEGIYLDGRSKRILAGGVSALEDDTAVHSSDSRTTSTNERSDRVRRSWQLSWSVSATFVTNLFHVCRNSKGFLFISPIDEERVATGMPLKNTATGLNSGDGTTKTFQLQHQVSLSRDIGGGSATSTPFDVNYPLAGTVVGYKNGVSATLDDVDLDSGIITFNTAPGNGVVTTADYQRAIPVMFTSKTISRTLLEVDQSEVRSAQIEEIF